MSKKATYILCVVLFVVLIALFGLEVMNPEGGVKLLQSLLG